MCFAARRRRVPRPAQTFFQQSHLCRLSVIPSSHIAIYAWCHPISVACCTVFAAAAVNLGATPSHCPSPPPVQLESGPACVKSVSLTSSVVVLVQPAWPALPSCHGWPISRWDLCPLCEWCTSRSPALRVLTLLSPGPSPGPSPVLTRTYWCSLVAVFRRQNVYGFSRPTLTILRSCKLAAQGHVYITLVRDTICRGNKWTIVIPTIDNCPWGSAPNGVTRTRSIYN